MTRLGGRQGLVCCAATLVALGLTFGASSSAAVTIGEVTQTPEPTYCEAIPFDVVQPTVNSGNSYVVPSTGGITSWTVTSWSTSRSADTAGQSMALKLFRKVAEPRTFMVVGHEGPHNLVGGINTFAANIQAKAGDVLGANATGGGACAFERLGETTLFRADSNLADGESGPFDTSGDDLLNARAEITPTSSFTLGKVKAKKNGTATLQVRVPNPGRLTVSGKGVKGTPAASAAKKVDAGKVKVVIRAKGKNKRKLAENGTVTVKPKITFTPTGGTSHTEKKKVKLRRK